jgi:hypothetical protein
VGRPRSTKNPLTGLDIQQRAVIPGVEMQNARVDQAGKAGVPSVFAYKIQPYSGSAGTSVTARNGKAYQLPTPEAAHGFKQQSVISLALATMIRFRARDLSVS